MTALTRPDIERLVDDRLKPVEIQLQMLKDESLRNIQDSVNELKIELRGVRSDLHQVRDQEVETRAKLDQFGKTLNNGIVAKIDRLEQEFGVRDRAQLKLWHGLVMALFSGTVVAVVAWLLTQA